MIDLPSRPVPATPPLDERVAALRARIRGLGSCVVAYSGGVDSSVVLAVAREELGERALAVIGRSATYAASELELALAQAGRMGVVPRVVATAELDDARFADNPSNRCYFCKGELYVRLSALARAEGYAAVLDGTNADDLADHRPGRRAADEHAVLSPLAELGFAKADVRALATRLGLPSADKPAMPCLSSRFPYGSRISAEQLAQVEAGEGWLRARGFRDVRLRHHGTVARLELDVSELARLAAEPLRGECVAALKALGFAYVTLDLQGFRSGSLNETLPAASSSRPIALRVPS
ncbi:MAG: ATP-dependent sacrificial sulfur transferase LarE [Candidatus Eisenbacteria bacterium]